MMFPAVPPFIMPICTTTGLRAETSLHQRLDRILQGITSAYRGSHRIRYLGGVGPVVNHPAMTDLVRAEAIKTVGIENVLSQRPTMGSDDVARFLEAVPGCYFSLGAANKEKGIQSPIHTPRFDIDESALVFGIETMVRSALTYLHSQG